MRKIAFKLELWVTIWKKLLSPGNWARFTLFTRQLAYLVHFSQPINGKPYFTTTRFGTVFHILVYGIGKRGNLCFVIVAKVKLYKQ